MRVGRKLYTINYESARIESCHRDLEGIRPQAEILCHIHQSKSHMLLGKKRRYV